MSATHTFSGTTSRTRRTRIVPETLETRLLFAAGPIVTHNEAAVTTFTAVNTAFLDILGVGCEPTLKYYEQFLHWPRLTLDSSRLVNLASWVAMIAIVAAVKAVAVAIRSSIGVPVLRNSSISSRPYCSRPAVFGGASR